MITIDEIKQKHNGIGQHFFDPATMRFFASRTLDEVHEGSDGGIYFITSEKKCFDDPTRVFTIRKFDPETGSISTKSELGQFGTAYLAKKELKTL